MHIAAQGNHIAVDNGGGTKIRVPAQQSKIPIDFAVYLGIAAKQENITLNDRAFLKLDRSAEYHQVPIQHLTAFQGESSAKYDLALFGFARVS